MSSQLKKVICLDDELNVSMHLLKCGLRELKRTNAINDFVPFLLISSGLERLMKIIICLYRFEKDGCFPKYQEVKQNNHNIISLIKDIAGNCFSDNYLNQIPVAEEDKKYLDSDVNLLQIISILTGFGEGGRYYNLDVITGKSKPGPSPQEEWNKLEFAIFEKNPNIREKMSDAKEAITIHSDIKQELIVYIERAIRALCRLLTIGKLGELGLRMSPITHHFLFLGDSDLGKTDYDKELNN